MKKWLLPIMLLVLLIAIGCIGIYFYNPATAADQSEKPANGSMAAAPDNTAGQPPKDLPRVVAQPAQPEAISRTLELTGSVTATKIARLAAPVEGPVQNCRVREGDRVEPGQQVVVIGRSRGAEALLAAAQQALSEQSQELSRVKQLVDNGAIPGAQLDTARSKYENARAQFAKAKESAEDYSITSPWAGVVSKVLVADGDYVTPRATLIEIYDPRSLAVQLAVPEGQSTVVREKMPVRVELDAYPKKRFRGEISRVYPELDTRMRTRTVEVSIQDPIDLIPGMFARTQVVLEEVRQALVVPVEAVRISPNESRIAFVVQDGKAVLRKIETGIEAGGRVQILKGIDPGEQVIVAGHEKLKDGSAVRVDKGGSK
ncbi:efflux RND transporter periplasmic adaptor subunit [Desulfoferrobacter suflitae]|uniref:efflux RND transporter periplasmic adaptor subunit n=1 Tax=Desulfoferrobacter suflitae TaxID=2865782 RepID=UPI002163FFE2|nr:efflux RND transporter periplasmic adaptor subunit [Desulfoferrobacter suflitae]MCK8603668.1 efflux RND transporter periplasmic adaptor subunit [Desulfoferrobacter suflitae]